MSKTVYNNLKCRHFDWHIFIEILKYLTQTLLWLSGRNSEIFSHYFQVANDGSDPNRAEHSAPNGLSIRRSHIPMAGAGVWADKPIPRGVRFGPYEGKEVHDPDDAHKSGYCWMVGCHLATTNITQPNKDPLLDCRSSLATKNITQQKSANVCRSNVRH